MAVEALALNFLATMKVTIAPITMLIITNTGDTQMACRIWQNMSPWLAKRMVILLSHEAPAYMLDKMSYKVLSLDQ